MGVTSQDVKKMVENGAFEMSYVGGAWNLFGTIVTENTKVTVEETSVEIVDLEEEETMEISSTYQNIEVEYGAGTLNIFYGDVSNIQITQKNVLSFSTETNEEDGTLMIRANTNRSDILSMKNTSDMVLTIILPKDLSLETVDLELSASESHISDLKADKISLEIGAGVANLSGIDANNVTLEIGAGELIAKNLSVRELEVDAGVGEADIEISGAETDYNYDVECGIGDVTVGKSSYSGMGVEQTITNSGAEAYMGISCGVGSVNVHFTCDTETCVNPSHNHNLHHNEH